MGKLNLAIAIIVVVGAVIVTTDVARGATVDCSTPALNVISFNSEYGFRPFIVGIGSSWWKGKQRLAAVANSPKPCDPVAAKAYADQQRFYVLLRAFPAKPTKGQWQARFVPLMHAATAADGDFLTIISGPASATAIADRKWLISTSKTTFGSVVE